MHEKAKIKACMQTEVPPGPVTCGEVLNDARRCGVEDDVGTLVQVMQVIATVKSSVAKHVVEGQLLHSHTKMKAALRGTNPHRRNCVACETAKCPLKTFCCLMS